MSHDAFSFLSLLFLHVFWLKFVSVNLLIFLSLFFFQLVHPTVVFLQKIVMDTTAFLLWVGAFRLHGDWPREADIYLLVQVLKVMAITLLKLRLYEPLHRKTIFLARILFLFLHLVAFILSLLTPFSLIYATITSCTFFLLLWIVIILPPCSRELITPNPTASISGYFCFPSRPFRRTQSFFFKSSWLS